MPIFDPNIFDPNIFDTGEETGDGGLLDFYWRKKKNPPQNELLSLIVELLRKIRGS